MLLSLFKKSPLLAEEAVVWLEQGFAWCLDNFGSAALQRSVLVQPTDQYFSGRENSAEGMAALILGHVQNYAGLSHWPLQVVDVHQSALPEQSPVVALLAQPGGQLQIPFEPRQVASPEVMIANYAHTLAHHLAHLAKTPPPCDPDQWLHLTELLAVYLGFGVMLVNTASPYRGGGCARCVSPALERQGALSEDETAYALALFCSLKRIDEKEATRHLKSSLRPFFKRALKEIAQRPSLQALRQISSDPGLRFRAIPAP